MPFMRFTFINGDINGAQSTLRLNPDPGLPQPVVAGPSSTAVSDPPAPHPAVTEIRNPAGDPPTVDSNPPLNQSAPLADPDISEGTVATWQDPVLGLTGVVVKDGANGVASVPLI